MLIYMSLVSCVCRSCWVVLGGFFFFKQKTAYEMRISDWSSDVCSSDLLHRHARFARAGGVERIERRARGHRAVVGQPGAVRDQRDGAEIGRASCRERVCQYV